MFDFPAGFSDYPEHDHSADAQEEVYVVLSGSAEFAVNGETLRLDPEPMLRIGTQTRRKLTPGSDGVRILAIGLTPGRPYKRPEGLTIENDREER